MTEVLTSDEQKIFDAIKEILVRDFEIEESRIRLDARLYEDLDIDSIDAVDMIVQLQKVIEKRFKPEDFKSVKTVKDVVDVVEKILAQ